MGIHRSSRRPEAPSGKAHPAEKNEVPGIRIGRIRAPRRHA